MTTLDMRSPTAREPLGASGGSGSTARLTPAAFAQQAEAMRPRLRSVARRVLGDDPHVEDVVQEAIVQGRRALARFRGEAKLTTWMHRIVTNAALMHLRRHRRCPELPFGDVSIPLASHVAQASGRADETPERRLLERERIQRLSEALALEPESTRDLVALSCVEECSHSEVAARLGLSKSAVKTRLFRTRQRLRATLDASLGERGGPSGRISDAGV